MRCCLHVNPASSLFLSYLSIVPALIGNFYMISLRNRTILLLFLNKRQLDPKRLMWRQNKGQVFKSSRDNGEKWEGQHGYLNVIGGGLVTKSCLILMTLWTLASQAPLSMGFLRWEYWSRFFISQVIFPI